jgi:AraC family transcriptional regulator, exoenzyme S synthesis regulatory protein ExsA
MSIEQTEIKYKGKVVFERLVMPANFKRAPKIFTENEACFLFLSKGAFQLRTPNQLLRFGQGDAMLSKCGNYFIENIMPKNTLEPPIIAVIGAFFYPDMVKGFFQADLSIQEFGQLCDTSKINIEPLMKSYIDGLNFMLDNTTIADENLIITKLKELLLLLSKSEKAKTIQRFVKSLFVANEYNFNEIIQQNLYSNLTVPQFAYLCHMSLATFKRNFSTYYHQSPAKYITQQKLNKAKALLSQPSKSISEIAYECGFDSLSNFDKVFKRYYKMAPKAYKMNQIDK